MSEALPTVHLARHGETSWSLTGRHTGRSDVQLTERGQENARALGKRLAGIRFDRVYTSGLDRQIHTCELAGFGDFDEVDPALVEWDYGDYEGYKTSEILANRPQWNLFEQGCPGGESTVQVAARADRVIARWRARGGNILAFSSGHFSRVLAARWCAQPVTFGKHLYLATAALNILGYEHNLAEPCLRLWNDCRHVHAAK